MTYGMISIFYLLIQMNVILMRITRKALISALLILSVIPLVLVPSVNSQTYTTITTWSTVRGQVTSTQYSRYVVGTTTATLTVTDTIFDETFTVKGVSAGYCYHHRFIYDGLAGERLQGKWISNYIINFYIMSQSDYGNFKYCAQTHPSYITLENAVGDSIDWVVPQDGKLYFIFENYARASAASVERTVTFTLYKVYAQSTTSLLYSTASTAILYTTVQTLSSVSISQVSQPFALSGNNLLFIGLTILVVVFVLIILLMRKRRASTSRVTTAIKSKEEPRREGRKEKEETKFCINCGAELPLRAKFCNKCGATQQ